jgi:hypothetical protein
MSNRTGSMRLPFERHFPAVASQAMGLGPTPVFQRETMAFLRGLGRLDEHWILKLQYLSGNEKGLASLQGLDFPTLAPGPGLEPGTYGLTGGRSDGLQAAPRLTFRSDLQYFRVGLFDFQG